MIDTPLNFWPLDLVQWTQVLIVPVLLISAAIAIFQLRRNMLQARAAFLLELESKWDRIVENRKLDRQMRDSVRDGLFAKHSNKKDSEQEKQLRQDYREYLIKMRKDESQSFVSLVEYWGFFETVGLMVRKRYIPFGDVYGLYKGPLIELDRACTEFVAHWQREAHVPDGLFKYMLYLSRRSARRARREDRIKSLCFWKKD